jgi:hypothetical protein
MLSLRRNNRKIIVFDDTAFPINPFMDDNRVSRIGGLECFGDRRVCLPFTDTQFGGKRLS